MLKKTFEDSDQVLKKNSDFFQTIILKSQKIRNLFRNN